MDAKSNGRIRCLKMQEQLSIDRIDIVFARKQRLSNLGSMCTQSHSIRYQNSYEICDRDKRCVHQSSR